LCKYLFQQTTLFKQLIMGIFSAILGNAGSVSTDELSQKFGQLLTENETIELGFKLIRDTFIFTSKRLILVDVQGITGNKTEYKSIAYRSISRFSIETAGTFDLDAELKIWIAGEQQPSIKKQFNKAVNVYDVQKVLAFHVLN
jgi:hypothetical protein